MNSFYFVSCLVFRAIVGIFIRSLYVFAFPYSYDSAVLVIVQHAAVCHALTTTPDIPKDIAAGTRHTKVLMKGMEVFTQKLALRVYKLFLSTSITPLLAGCSYRAPAILADAS